MTRINLAIPVENLTDEHLRAEHREIKRICHNFAVRYSNNSMKNLPNNFCLGTGHVLFFINKPTLTLNRYLSLYKECIKRNFNVQNYSDNWNIYNGHFDYSKEPKFEVNDNHIQMIVERIVSNINTGKQQNYHYYGERISKQKAIDIIRQS